MGWVFQMVFLKELDIFDEGSCPWGWVAEHLLPIIEAASIDSHGITKKVDWEFSGQFKDYLIFLLLYRMIEPSPFTS